MTQELTVLVPTYRRPDSLGRLLEGFAAQDRTGLDVEFAIVDNDCSDEARAIVESWAGRLPLRYLREEVPGKNRALNRGLADVSLREVVVFTDDDVDPGPGWLQAIAATCERWPDHDVFGGSVHIVWPASDVPTWARDPYVKEFAFTHHEYAAEECLYGGGRVPFGPNFWVRRRVLDSGRHFDVGIGPHPTRRLLGDETLFLLQLHDDGHAAVYTPHAVVGHRIEPKVISPSWVRRRARQLGRGKPYVYGLPRRKLLESNPLAWRTIRVLSALRFALLAGLAMMHPSPTRRVLASLRPLRELASNRESLRIAGGRG